MAVVLSSHFASYVDLATMSKASRGMRHTVSQIISLRVNDVLRKWIDPDGLFWSTLDDTRAVIGGAVPLRVLDHPRNPWIAQALDVYVQNMWGEWRILQAMFANLGYTDWALIRLNRTSKRRSDGYPSWSERGMLCDIYVAHKLDRTIRIFVVDHVDALAAIPYTWSTLFVNAITPDHFLCAYPKSTLEREGYISPAAWPDVSFQAMQQCHAEGFRIRAWSPVQTDGSPVHGSLRYDVHELRSFRDSQTLRFDMNTSMLLGRPSLVPFATTRVKLASWKYGVFSTAN